MWIRGVVGVVLSVLGVVWILQGSQRDSRIGNERPWRVRGARRGRPRHRARRRSGGHGAFASTTASETPRSAERSMPDDWTRQSSDIAQVTRENYQSSN